MIYQDDFTFPTELLKQVVEQGLDFLTELTHPMIKKATHMER